MGGMDKLTRMLDYLLQEVRLAAPPALWDYAPGAASRMLSAATRKLPFRGLAGQVLVTLKQPQLG